MSAPERIVENLNGALHDLMENDPRVRLIGEDLLDPYGGAFKASRGLSTRFPGRVISTPISEAGFAGLAAGLALCGERPILEVMFGDFLALCFDPLLNFASKSVTMYGERRAFHLLVRCPVGGRRGYGPTHSQSLQKHFIGIPNLELHELTPFHDSRQLLPRLLDLGRPCLLFEPKSLYTRPLVRERELDDLFSWDRIGGVEEADALVHAPGAAGTPILLLTSGSCFAPCLGAARTLLIEHEVDSRLLVTSTLYPVPVERWAPVLRESETVIVVEEGSAGGTWGSEVAAKILGGGFGVRKILSLSSRDSIIPSARHLEDAVLIDEKTIVEAALKEAGRV